MDFHLREATEPGGGRTCSRPGDGPDGGESVRGNESEGGQFTQRFFELRRQQARDGFQILEEERAARSQGLKHILRRAAGESRYVWPLLRQEPSQVLAQREADWHTASQRGHAGPVLFVPTRGAQATPDQFTRQKQMIEPLRVIVGQSRRD